MAEGSPPLGIPCAGGVPEEGGPGGGKTAGGQGLPDAARPLEARESDPGQARTVQGVSLVRQGVCLKEARGPPGSRA